MRHYQFWLVCASSIVASVLIGSGENANAEPDPIPSEYASFVGVWEHGRYGQGKPYVYVQITADGYLSMGRMVDVGIVEMCVENDQADIENITSTEISFLWAPWSTKSKDLEINEPPNAYGDALRMTIDGHELTRTDSREYGIQYSWTCDGGKLHREPAN